MSQRRLPIYLLLDCSESMAGAAIDELSRALDSLITGLRANPLALETACLSVITFARYAKQVTPLSDVLSFQTPRLSFRTGTALGAALLLLLECLEREVVKTTPTTKGDYKPLVFLFTDGQPTDNWEPAADILRKANSPRIANIYAVGCGPDVDTEMLYKVTDIVLRMPDLTPDAIRKAFVWLSASVQSASTKFAAGPAQGPIDMPALPEGILEVAPRSAGYRDPTPRQVFLHARCQKTGRPYLMRFARQDYGGRYEAIASHPMKTIEDDDDDFLPPIQSSLLDGFPSCPYCSNPVAAVCTCGAIFCDAPQSTGPVTCPSCHAQLMAGGGGDFAIQRAQG